jgi:hypothetical protein
MNKTDNLESKQASTTFQGTSSAMGVASKMSSDERSPVIISFKRAKLQRDRDSLKDDPAALGDDTKSDDGSTEGPADSAKPTTDLASGVPEPKRKRGRPPKKAEPATPNDSKPPPAESEAADTTEPGDAESAPKRIRTRTKRFVSEEAPSPAAAADGNSSAKRKRGRPPKADSQAAAPVSAQPAMPDLKDELEEDLSESSSERWCAPEFPARPPAEVCASPEPSSASSSIGSCSNSPLRIGGSLTKRPRGRPRLGSIGERPPAVASPSTPQVVFRVARWHIYKQKLNFGKFWRVLRLKM